MCASEILHEQSVPVEKERIPISNDSEKNISHFKTNFKWVQKELSPFQVVQNKNYPIPSSSK